MKPIDRLLDQYELTHGNLCPGKVLGIRMAVLGCHLVGVEDPRGADQKKLIVWIEIDRWLADAVEAVTGARLGNRTLKFLDYGKLAASFLNVETGEAVRIVALESSRRLADLRHPEIKSKHVRQMTVYREATDEELFEVGFAEVGLTEMDAPGHPRSRVVCAHCCEGVNDGREVSVDDGSVLCRGCAFDIGYKPDSRSQENVDGVSSDKIRPVGSIWSSQSISLMKADSNARQEPLQSVGKPIVLAQERTRLVL